MTLTDWKRSLYALLALPACLFGAHGWLAARMFGAPERAGTPRYLAGAGVSVVAIPVSLLVWFLVWRIATYGLFWDPRSAAESWGGPSLAGAWLVHFFCALGMALVALWVLRPVTDVQVRLLSGRVDAGTRVSST